MIGALLTLPWRALTFAVWFGWQLVTSSSGVMADVLTPASEATPRVVRLPLGDAGDIHLTAISILITLTPGTLALGVVPESDGQRAILVHSMYHPDAAAALADLHDMDRRLVAALTLGGRPW